MSTNEERETYNCEKCFNAPAAYRINTMGCYGLINHFLPNGERGFHTLGKDKFDRCPMGLIVHEESMRLKIEEWMNSNNFIPAA